MGSGGETWGREEKILEKGKYIRGRLLGQGAFSRVYYVEHRGTGKAFACKVSGNTALLENEAKFLAGMRHPLFLECFELWREEGLGFLVTEYVPGSNMEDMLARRGSFAAGQVVRAGMELAEGLLYFHESRGRPLFRDVKPANIMVRQDGRLKLLDFGCACFTGEGARSHAGSPGYAAPEQISGTGVLTAACDVYGLGRTMGRMLGVWGGVSAGKPSGAGMRQKGLQKSLMRVLDACTRQDYAKRIPDMRGVMAALLPLAGTEGRGAVFGYGKSSSFAKIIYGKSIYEISCR